MFIAQFVTGLGYVSLAVDSFATRSIKDACTKPMPALMLARQGDALGALSYLSKLPSVDPQRIAVLGGSQGGMVALQLASTHHVETFDAPRDLKFKAAVAYYPLCGVASEELIVPALILIGELDDWTPARDCELWMKRRADRGARPGFRRRQGNARALAQVRCESGQECSPGDAEFPLCSILPLSNSEANAHTRLEQRPVIGSDSEVG